MPASGIIPNGPDQGRTSGPPFAPRLPREGAPPAQAPQMPAQAPGGPGIELVPQPWRERGYGPQQYADWLMSRARNHAMAGDTEGAKVLQAQAEPLYKAIGQAAELTPEQKNARAAGMSPLEFERAKELQKTDVGLYSKLYAGLSAMGNTAAQSLPQIHAAQSIINHPSFYSGPWADKVLAGRQLLAGLGLNQNAALTQEAFGKTMASFVLKQTDDLRAQAIEMGSGSSRVFAQQIDLMVKAAPSPEYTRAGNRYLVEVYARGAQRAMMMADAAAKYNNGHLDAQFETGMRHWMATNPMFSKAEIADPRLVAPPVFANVAQARAAGLKSGEVIKLPTGEIGVMP